MKVTNPVLKYYGSKFRLASWILSYFPAHRHYVEPFGGAANVLLVKEPSALETYNDLNEKIVNFFRVLRSRPEELTKQINLTPWARREYEYCFDEQPSDTEIEQARKLFFRLWMSISGQFNSCRSSWRRDNQGKRKVLAYFKPENLFAAAERLKSVQIENRDAFKLIRETDSPDTLFYLDPPYVFSTRTTSAAYSHEMTNSAHREFAELLYELKGFVVLSGYPSAIYEELFEAKGWVKTERAARVLGGALKVEALWLSPRTAAALGILPQQEIEN